jgi:hypothetical protein
VLRVTAAIAGTRWSRKFVNQKLTVNMMIIRVKFWCLLGAFGGGGITYTPCYIHSGKKRTESEAGKTRQDIELQIRWLWLAMRLLDALRYIPVSTKL